LASTTPFEVVRPLRGRSPTSRPGLGSAPRCLQRSTRGKPGRRPRDGPTGTTSSPIGLRPQEADSLPGAQARTRPRSPLPACRRSRSARRGLRPSLPAPRATLGGRLRGPNRGPEPVPARFRPLRPRRWLACICGSSSWADNQRPPGLVSVREAVVDGMSEYRFLRGGEAYKDRFATRDPGVETITLAESGAGRAALAAAGLRRTAGRVRHALSRH
jgi:hypothetical protein